MPRRRRVLIADDNRELADVLARLIDLEPDLQCVGHVATARHAVDRARDTGADVLVLDIGLPDGRGLDVLDEAAAIAPHLGVVVFTGSGSPEVSTRARSFGAACVQKGGDFDELLGHIRHAAPLWSPPELWYG